jgi:hypothetical protein
MFTIKPFYGFMVLCYFLRHWRIMFLFFLCNKNLSINFYNKIKIDINFIAIYKAIYDNERKNIFCSMTTKNLCCTIKQAEKNFYLKYWI